MRVDYTGQHRIPNKDIEVYVFDTNLKVVPHDDKDDGPIPGLFALLRDNQENRAWPYTVTNACVRYKRKGTGVNGIPKQMVKKLVPLDAVEVAYRKSRINLWMFEVIGPDNSKLVLRIWNSNGNLEVASFDDEDGRVEDFINEALRLPGERYDDEDSGIESCPDDSNDATLHPDASDDDASGHSPYMPDGGNPVGGDVNTEEHGIVPTSPYMPQAYDGTQNETASPKRVGGGGSLAVCIVSLVTFLAQAVMSFVATAGGMTFTGIFGILASIALVGVIVTAVKRGGARKGKTVSMIPSKVLAGILLGSLIIELVAIVTIAVMLFTQTLPRTLHFLYDIM